MTKRDIATLEERLFVLERQNVRQRKIGLVALLLICTTLLIGAVLFTWLN